MKAVTSIQGDNIVNRMYVDNEWASCTDNSKHQCRIIADLFSRQLLQCWRMPPSATR